MKMITCFDVFENPHEVLESDMTFRLSVYGILIQDTKVLLTKDAWAKQWEIPGGGVDEGESEEAALKREIFEETGLSIKEVSELVESFETNFYMISEKKGYRSLRKFYKMNSILDGELQKNGNGIDTIGARFASLDEINQLSDEEMKPIYKDIIKKAIV